MCRPHATGIYLIFMFYLTAISSLVYLLLPSTMESSALLCLGVQKSAATNCNMAQAPCRHQTKALYQI